MDQVSRPLLIALAATVALVAIWLVALRPKPVEIDKTPLGPTQALPKAKQAAATANGATANVEAAANAAGETTAPATAGPTQPATATEPPETVAEGSVGSGAAPADRREAAVQSDIRAGKVVVMLFWNAKSADDIATRAAIRRIDRRGGKVAVHIVPIGRVGRYESITKGVTVAQSPTTLVIGRKSRTRAIVGLTEPQELGQAVSDALAGH